jgi:hypothetical protein
MQSDLNTLSEPAPLEIMNSVAAKEIIKKMTMDFKIPFPKILEKILKSTSSSTLAP